MSFAIREDLEMQELAKQIKSLKNIYYKKVITEVNFSKLLFARIDTLLERYKEEINSENKDLVK